MDTPRPKEKHRTERNEGRWTISDIDESDEEEKSQTPPPPTENRNKRKRNRPPTTHKTPKAKHNRKGRGERRRIEPD